MAKIAKTVEPANEMSGTGCLVRLGWMMFGNAALLFCAINIVNHRGSFFSIADAVFWPVVIFLIWLRRFDITRMKGQTASGQPATLSHWKRYSAGLLIFAVVLWSVAHAMTWFQG